eukprot:TRINITY_DN63239_c0_g1_i1.p1 TRINITY_DN63239_c0_g1~~TRINITY_DN63239_c0_g1_i1.p1  ORF type:complete len:223 (-),score=32.77 TRINITY_DN63239_c0_g1_i1:71-739(-)
MNDNSDRTVILGCPVVLDFLACALWFLSIHLDDPPFEKESEEYGMILTMLALVTAGLGIVVASTAGPLSSNLFFPLLLAKVSFLLGTCMWTFRIFSKKKLEDNIGYLLLFFIVTASSFFHLILGSRVLGGRPPDEARSVRVQQELMQMQMQQNQMYAAGAQYPQASQHQGVYEQRIYEQQRISAAPVQPVQHHHHHLTSIQVQLPPGAPALAPQPYAARPMR